jgi:hypothetical protein
MLYTTFNQVLMFRSADIGGVVERWRGASID